MQYFLKLAVFFMAAGLLCFSGCRKHDFRTVVIKVPALENQEQARQIQDAFIRYPGIKMVQPDIVRHEVKITYNSMVIARKNLEHAIADLGLDANDIPAQRTRGAIVSTNIPGAAKP